MAKSRTTIARERKTTILYCRKFNFDIVEVCVSLTKVNFGTSQNTNGPLRNGKVFSINKN
jgi:hypothetical protein